LACRGGGGVGDAQHVRNVLMLLLAGETRLDPAGRMYVSITQRLRKAIAPVGRNGVGTTTTAEFSVLTLSELLERRESCS
jgi:hypothetical protein